MEGLVDLSGSHPIELKATSLDAEQVATQRTRTAGRVALMAAAAERADGAAPVRRRGAGRPPQSEEQVAARRQHLVEAAYSVFRLKGYHAAVVGDITAEAGLAHGTFYRSFESKRDILDSVVDHMVASLMEMLTLDDISRIQTRSELRAHLTRLGDSLFTQVLDNDPHLVRLLVLEAASIDEDLLQRVLGLLESAVVSIARAISQGSQRGLLRADMDSESIARACIGFAAAAVASELHGAGMPTAARRRYIDAVVSLVIDNVDPATAER